MDPAVIREIVGRLETVYGIAMWKPGTDPVDELVSCILSQHTSDINSHRAFAELKAAYRDWDAVIADTPEHLAKVIWSGGLANSKAPRIQRVLVQLREEFGTVSLDALYDKSDKEARAYLMSLPGVGPKTAAIVLCFAMGRGVIPVDTHIFRVSWRLGLIEKKIGEAKAHDVLQEMVPADIIYRYHVALITHGRRVCKAISPRCSGCLVADLCRWNRDEQSKTS